MRSLSVVCVDGDSPFRTICLSNLSRSFANVFSRRLIDRRALDAIYSNANATRGLIRFSAYISKSVMFERFLNYDECGAIKIFTGKFGAPCTTGRCVMIYLPICEVCRYRKGGGGRGIATSRFGDLSLRLIEQQCRLTSQFSFEYTNYYLRNHLETRIDHSISRLRAIAPLERRGRDRE